MLTFENRIDQISGCYHPKQDRASYRVITARKYQHIAILGSGKEKCSRYIKIQSIRTTKVLYPFYKPVFFLLLFILIKAFLS